MQPRTAHPLINRLFDNSQRDEAEKQIAISELIEAALDQRKPTPELKRALNAALLVTDHPLQLAWRKHGRHRKGNS